LLEIRDDAGRVNRAVAMGQEVWPVAWEEISIGQGEAPLFYLYLSNSLLGSPKGETESETRS
jgi:hypothetical protein